MIAENPFYVLGLRPDCSAREVERAGQKLLAMLEVGMAEARSYATPLGAQDRDADAVRRAMDELRDPDRRLLHEIWATLAPEEAPRHTADAAPVDAPRWVGALAALGFAPRHG